MGIRDLLFVVLTAVTWTAAAPTRNWTDASGQFSVEAEMVNYENGVVHLKTWAGRIVKVPLEKLSPADREFVRQATSSKMPSPKTPADGDAIRIPLYPPPFQRTVWMEAADTGGTAEATIALGDGSRPSGPLDPAAIPSLTEGYYLGLAGRRSLQDAISALIKGAFAADELWVQGVEVIAVHEGGKLTIRFAAGAAAPAKKAETLVLLRPPHCSTAQLRSISGSLPLLDERAASPESVARLARSSQNLRQIVRAMQLFHHQHRRFPPAIVYGPDGKAWHSWRVLILPYLGHQPLCDEYRFDEPWDGPNNRKLLATAPDVYRDPVHGSTPDSYTHYAAVVGAPVAFGQEPRKPLDFLAPSVGLAGAMRQIEDFADGTASTILVGSISPERKIPWTKPEDLEWRDDFPPLGKSDGFAAPFRMGERAGGVFGFVDGHVCCIADSIDAKDFRSLLQVADGRRVRSIPELAPPRFGPGGIPVLEIPCGRAGAAAKLVEVPFPEAPQRSGAHHR